MKKFPPGFYFGAATSSHQVEGNCINDWSRWERNNAERLAAVYISEKSDPEDPFYKERSNPDNYISADAVDHYNLYEEDFALAEKIGLNAYRFSIEWSRIEPEEGAWSDNEITHYKQVISSLRKRNIEPFVTIWHWPLPLWLSESGGIMNPRFKKYFSRYAAKLTEKFANEVKFYITINEPEIYSLNSYMLGKWPPQKRGLFSYYRAINILADAHKSAFMEIKKINPDAQIGLSCNMSYFESAGGLLNNTVKKMADFLWNFYFINKIKPELDFIGLNYYFHNRINYGFNKNFNNKVSDMGWELYPSGISCILEKLKEFKLPVYITENGLADNADTNRAWFIHETLKEIYYSINNGVDVRGYFHWSLLDNFEWDKGFWPEFGLIHVERSTMKRTIRSSAEKYSDIIKRGLDI